MTKHTCICMADHTSSGCCRAAAPDCQSDAVVRDGGSSVDAGAQEGAHRPQAASEGPKEREATPTATEEEKSVICAVNAVHVV